MKNEVDMAGINFAIARDRTQSAEERVIALENRVESLERANKYFCSRIDALFGK